MKVSDYVIKFIENLGVRHVFTLSGGGCIHLIDSLGKSKKIEYVCNLHEQGAGCAAEAYGQYTNNIGVAIVTTGPGGTNILTPLAGAYLDSTPMLVIAGQVQTKDSAQRHGVRQMGFQEVDVIGMARPVTKWSFRVAHENAIRLALEKGVEEAKSGRPGPVIIEIPLDIQAKEVDHEEMFDGESLINKPKPHLESTIEKIAEKFAQSKRPIVLAGNGIRLSGAMDLFDQFIRKHNLPVLTTWKAADFLDENDPLFVGRPGAIAPRGANFNQQNSDFILCLGARLDHGQLAYQAKYFAPNAYKVVCDIDPRECAKLFDHMDLLISCDVGDLLKELLRLPTKSGTEDWLERCKDTYNRYPVCDPNYEKDGPINLYSFIYEMSKHAPEDALIVPGSSGACSEVVYQAWKIKKGQRLLNTPGLGSMGFGIGAAIGACLASGKKPTICIEGDGGWMMNIQELEVVRRLNLPITFFVLNNGGYGSIRSTQDGYFNGKYVASSAGSGVTLPDIQNIATAFHIECGMIFSNRQLDVRVPYFLTFRTPLVVEVMCDYDHKTLPRATVFQNEKGEFETAPMQFMKPPLSEEEQKENTIV